MTLLDWQICEARKKALINISVIYLCCDLDCWLCKFLHSY